MSHTTQHRTVRPANPAGAATLRAVARLAVRPLAFVLRTPALLLGLFIVAAVTQISLMLTLGHTPDQALMPASPAHHNTCVMFCHTDDSGPASHDAEPATAPADAHPASYAADSAPATTSSSSCWMLCPTPAGHSAVVLASDIAHGSESITWHLDL